MEELSSIQSHGKNTFLACNITQPGNRQHAQMVAWNLVFVFCPPQLTMLAAREQAKIKPPTIMLHKSRSFLTTLCPLNPQSREDCCYLVIVLAYAVIGICGSQGMRLKKQASKRQQACCHRHLSITRWVLGVGAWGPPNPNALRRPISCFFPLCLPYSNLLIWNYSWIYDPWEGRCSNKRRKPVRCLTLPLPWVLTGNLTTFLAPRVIVNASLGPAAGILFPGPSEDRKYHISISVDPFTLSATPRCLYKSPFHCGNKATGTLTGEASSKHGTELAWRAGRGLPGLSAPYLAISYHKACLMTAKLSRGNSSVIRYTTNNGVFCWKNIYSGN